MANPVKDQQGLPVANTPVLLTGIQEEQWNQMLQLEGGFGWDKEEVQQRGWGDNGSGSGLSGSDAHQLATAQFNPVWYKFFQYLWKKVGGGSEAAQSTGSATASTTTDSNGNPTATVTPNPQTTGPTQTSTQSPASVTIIEQVPASATPAGPATQATIGSISPQTWMAPSKGVLFVTKAQVEVSRDALFWAFVGPAGGAVPVESGDQVRLTWFGGSQPMAMFFPGT